MGTKRITLVSFTGAPNKRVFYETLNGVRAHLRIYVTVRFYEKKLPQKWAKNRVFGM